MSFPPLETPFVDPETGGIFLQWYAALLKIARLKETFLFPLYNAGAVLATGIQGDIFVPFASKITRCTVLADQTGNLVIDLWKDSYANFPPVVGDTITASAKPTLSSAIKYQSETLTDWTRDVSDNDIIRVNIDSVATIKRALLALDVVRT